MKNVGKKFKDYSLYFGMFFLALGFTGCSDDDDGDIIDPEPSGTISVQDQTVDQNSIVVTNVQTDEDGWLVLRRNNETGEQLADPEFIEEGTQNNVTIDLNADANLQDGETLALVLYEDNGDGIFDEANDFPFQNDMGGNVVATFTVSIDQGETGEVFSVGDQTITQNTIFVESINVEEEGWLVARNAGSEESPDVVSDTVHLDAGLNENVVLTLNENATLTGNEAGDDIVLMIHQDNGVTGEYEYDGESGIDEPLTNAETGEVVSQSVNVRGPSLTADDNQALTANNEVTFSNVNTAGNGWIALYGEDETGEIDYNNPIGQRYVEAGEHADFTVPFADDASIPATGETVYPRLYMDDPADEQFTYTAGGNEDLPETYGYDETTGEGRFVTNNATETGGFTIQ